MKDRKMPDYRPRIGITMRIELETDRFYLSRHYSEAVEAAGGAPLHISLIPNSQYIAAVMEALDGILLPGSDSDVDPLRYGREPHKALGYVHAIKDETDLFALEEIERRRLPLFGICFGMQVLNVSRGGTLIQDIASQVQDALEHEQGLPRDRPSHRIGLLEESRLASLAKRDAAIVNSHHHQAIETVGRDLVASAWASDGLVEALEDSRSDRFVMGVQWHPELGWERDSLSQELFRRFVSEAGQYARTVHPQLINPYRVPNDEAKADNSLVGINGNKKGLGGKRNIATT
ncbi:MAG: gamma-glutamyl-gamma-aminobutyrate hydrolase family protein [Pyrinomonadaceae bacterium]|nr:gamma-glutamyl-gamma-aminobutyrate hydrolase family protein [Pyrinomonadaceae bacterium]